MFENPKKIVAYAGLDPSVFESGEFIEIETNALHGCSVWFSQRTK